MREKNMKRPPLLHEKNAKYSKYESKMKWTLTHVQVIENMRQIPMEYKV